MGDTGMHQGALVHSEVLDLLDRAGIEDVEYRQSCHVSPVQDMTVGRYCWHDDTDARKLLFVLESYGNGKPKGS